MSRDNDSIEINPDGETVTVGDEFRVLEARTSLIPFGRISEGDTIELVDIERVNPSGPELVLSWENDGRPRRMSPTSMAEALDVVDYMERNTDEEYSACLERVE